MKTLLAFFLSVFFSFQLSAQCTPGNATTCPDPENNGEICPKVLPIAYVEVPYSQEVTILPPPTASFGSNSIPLHKIVVTAIENLPPGISYVSNAVNNEFFIGTYYCFLLSGTPTTTGHYPLKIYVDAYANLLGNVTKVGSEIDSTSLYIAVGWDPNSAEFVTEIKAVTGTARPNPFTDYTEIEFYTENSGRMTLHIHDIAGRIVEQNNINALRGKNIVPLDAAAFLPGTYYYSISGSQEVVRGVLLKR